MTESVRELVSRLTRDERRDETGFSEDVATVNMLLHHPYATDEDRQDGLSPWLQGQQPCLFGRVAAASNSLHYLFLDDDDLKESDAFIREKIQDGRIRWLRRSLSPAGLSSPAHGLVLAVVSPRVALAEPNDVLRQLAVRILELWGCAVTSEPHGPVHWEELFLERPDRTGVVKFTFSVDFFAAAGDGRWWHDHRMPGGIAFTANSVGHMKTYREWYQGKSGQEKWILETAMRTIALAKDTEFGRATWLRELRDGRPVVEGIACPVAAPHPSVLGFDWTRYSGHLHTDHSIRPEFFRPGAEKPPWAAKKEWIMDFQYLYDSSSKDHIRFVQGVPVSREEVVGRIGRPEEYVEIESPRRPVRTQRGDADIRGAEGRAQVEALLQACRQWAMSSSDLEGLQS